jgi:hypothetical protein
MRSLARKTGKGEEEKTGARWQKQPTFSDALLLRSCSSLGAQASRLPSLPTSLFNLTSYFVETDKDARV